MSHPPGDEPPRGTPPERPDPDPSAEGAGAPADPWASPPGGGSGGAQERVPYPPQPPDQPAYDQPPDQPAYGQPPYAQPPSPQYGGYGGYPRPANGKAQAAMWTGIGLLVLSFCCGAGILGFIPIVLGVKARSEIAASGGQQSGEGMALAGIITGAVAIALSLVFIALVVLAVMSGGGDFDSYSRTRA